MLEKKRGSEDPNEKRKGVQVGITESGKGMEELADEKKPHTEDGDWGWEKAIPDVDTAESKKHLEMGLEKVREIIAGVKGDFIGAHYVWDSHGYLTGQIELLENVGEEEINQKLALVEDWSALFDDQEAFIGGESGDGHDFSHFIGRKEIHSSRFSPNSDAGTFYYVAGEAVTPEDYSVFKEEVKRMLAENYKKRGTEYPERRELPPGMKEKVEKIAFDDRTEQVLKKGKVVAPGVIKLEHIYGSSYSGSGGGYGFVNAYDLAEWREGKRVKKEVLTRDGDNGFVSGPSEATLESGTILICKGANDTGRHGRKEHSWEEIYICE
ncbi:MAG: hypothetical protein NUV84_02335 [Candidatus Uhrbacteria bacterium]|nr:hypothetical protein [Candidatus Uhrbacteria bacterium]